MIQLLALKAAHMMDTVGDKEAQDRDHGCRGRRSEHDAEDGGPGHSGAGDNDITNNYHSPLAYAHLRTLRLADER